MSKDLGNFGSFLSDGHQEQQRADIKEHREDTIKDDGSTSKRTGSSTSKGLHQGLTRATFIAQAEKVEALKALAWYERKKVQDIFDDMLNVYFESKGKEEVKKAVKGYNKTK